MIAGWPHRSGGLFEVACDRVEKTLKRSIQSRLTSLGSFSAPRAEKHIKRRALDFKPGYVVVQFGATDAQCPIRRKPRSSASTGNAREVFHAPNVLTLARWEIASLMGFLMKTEARTPLSAYIDAIARMADNCISDGAKPIILSPFVFGSRYSTRSALLFTNALQELQSRKRPMILVDCVRVMSNFPRSKMLMNDGFHLSAMAHNLVGETVGDLIVADVARADRSESGTVSAASSAATEPTLSATRRPG
jgi:hypothetical protein